jgi:ABC-type uncharacterized transport system involved in gliding motility auxiliary subunit
MIIYLSLKPNLAFNIHTISLEKNVQISVYACPMIIVSFKTSLWWKFDHTKQRIYVLNFTSKDDCEVFREHSSVRFIHVYAKI